LFIVEAESDALLLWQAAGDEVDVVALAGAGRNLSVWDHRTIPITIMDSVVRVANSRKEKK